MFVTNIFPKGGGGGGGVGGSQQPNYLKESINQNWNFQRDLGEGEVGG